jgi:hypothetical protein
LGYCGILGIIITIFLPMLLFSSFNFFGVINPIIGMEIEVKKNNFFQKSKKKILIFKMIKKYSKI